MSRYIRHIFGAAAFVLVVGCSSVPTIPEYARYLAGEPSLVEDLGGGVTLVVVDATNTQDWLYFDLDEVEVVSVVSSEEDLRWDLAFQRFNVKSNGGASGNGGVQVAITGSTDFDNPPSVDDAEWGQDEPGLGSGVIYTFVAQGDWYRYDLGTHMLASRESVIYIRSTEGTVFKLQMVSYYDRILLAGYPTFRFSGVQ